MFRSKNNQKNKPFYSLLVSSATMKVVISSLSVLALANAAPSCEPQNYQQMRWYTCKYNPEKWYGISKNKGNFDIATSICADASTNPSKNPGQLFEAHNAQDDLCLFNAMKLDSHGAEKLALISGKAQRQNVWNVTNPTGSASDLDQPGANFWKWCPNDQNVELEDCPDGENMTYHNENTGESGSLDGTDFKYHITSEQLKNSGNKVIQAKIYHNAQQFDKDYGWTMLGAGQVAHNNDFYFTCTIDCTKQ